MYNPSYPTRHDNPNWEQLFLSLDDADVGSACTVWFEQWCQVDNLWEEYRQHYAACMPALHALSNRTAANIDILMKRFDDEDDALRQKMGYTWARSLLTSAIAGVGWDGFAMRCWTDPLAYAGYMQHIENQGGYDIVDDLADYPHAGKKLKEALALYGQHLPYPWIGAACIRWAIFGHNTIVEDLPTSVQWLKMAYSTRQTNENWGLREIVSQPMVFSSAQADVIKALLQSPDLWNHMLLQEASCFQQRSTLDLWLHWAISVGHECSKETELYDNRDYAALVNCLIQGDAVELEIMRLTGLKDYLLQKARGNTYGQEKLELPSELGMLH